MDDILLGEIPYCTRCRQYHFRPHRNPPMIKPQPSRRPVYYTALAAAVVVSIVLWYLAIP